jgi:hypothetical protein
MKFLNCNLIGVGRLWLIGFTGQKLNHFNSQCSHFVLLITWLGRISYNIVLQSVHLDSISSHFVLQISHLGCISPHFVLQYTHLGCLNRHFVLQCSHLGCISPHLGYQSFDNDSKTPLSGSLNCSYY